MQQSDFLFVPQFMNRILVVGLLLLASIPMPGWGNDYLNGNLRARVDQLIANLDTIPTSTTNAPARARLFWDWLNAYAVNGGYVPVNATLVVAQVLGRKPQAPNDIPELVLKSLDDSIRELALLDTKPDAVGILEADVGPYVAGSVGTIQQRYTVGSQSIQTGGGFLVARHFMANFGAWQVREPDADNYVSIESSNPKVSFVATTTPMSGMHGGFRSTRPTLTFKLASGTLNPGDVVTITYGDQRQGSKGLRMPSFSSDRMPLPLYVMFANRTQPISLPIQPIQITGTTIDGVAGFAPSILKPFETFTLSIRAQDRFFNRANGDIPDWQLSLNGAPWRDVKSTGAITEVPVSLSDEGVHFISIVSSDGQIRGEVNPIQVVGEPNHRVYWGDTHGHSGFAEGIGTPDRFMRWAKEDARLDYVTHSEHDVWLDDAEWEVLRNNVESFSEDGRFIAYLGYEWSVPNERGGHHNVLFRTPQARNRIAAQFYPTLSRLYQGLRTNADTKDVVVIPHAHQAGDHRHSDPELEPLVEIMSQHGNFEWFGRLYLQHGHQVGFTAASDNHLSQPGYSAPLGGSLSQRGGLGAIMADELSNDAIFDNMKALRSYATTGDRIILDFSVNDIPMGQRGPFDPNRLVKGRVIGTAPIDRISIIKNDQVVWSQDYAKAPGNRAGKQAQFLLTFDSDSTPYHPGDNPRGWRTWEGTLEFANASLVSIEPYDAGMPGQTVTVSAESPNRANFSTKSRGNGSSFLITLNDVQRTTRLNIDLVETVETGGAPPLYRPPQRIPAESFSLALRDMEDGRVSHRQDIEGYADQTTLRRIVTDGPRDVAFEFTDEGKRHGDYYYVRIEQVNDAAAWSSPVWIGGHAKH